MGQGAKIWVGERYQRMQELRKVINAKNKNLQTPQDIRVIDTGHLLMWGVVARAILTLLIRKMGPIILRIWEHKYGCQAGFHSPGFQSLFWGKGQETKTDKNPLPVRQKPRGIMTDAEAKHMGAHKRTWLPQSVDSGQEFWGVLMFNLNIELLSNLYIWNCGVKAIHGNVLLWTQVPTSKIPTVKQTYQLQVCVCSQTLFYKIKHKDRMMLDMLIF